MRRGSPESSPAHGAGEGAAEADDEPGGSPCGRWICGTPSLLQIDADIAAALHRRHDHVLNLISAAHLRAGAAQVT